jgi:hypothetical protein
MEIQYQPQAWTRVRFKGVALNHVKNPDNAPEPIRTQLVEFRTKLNALGFCVHDPKQSGLDVTAQILPIWFVYAFYACIWGALFLYGYAVFTYNRGWKRMHSDCFLGHGMGGVDLGLDCHIRRTCSNVSVTYTLLSSSESKCVESPVLTESLGETDMACMNQTNTRINRNTHTLMTLTAMIPAVSIFFVS